MRGYNPEAVIDPKEIKVGTKFTEIDGNNRYPYEIVEILTATLIAKPLFSRRADGRSPRHVTLTQDNDHKLNIDKGRWYAKEIGNEFIPGISSLVLTVEDQYLGITWVSQAA